MGVEEYELPPDESGGTGWVQRRTLTEIEADRQRQAFDVAFPIPDELNQRIGLITRLREVEIPIIVRAKVQFALIEAIRDDKGISQTRLAPIESLLEYLVSAKGAGRKEIVDIARVQPKPEKRGFLGFGR